MKLLLHICCGPCALYPIKKLLKGSYETITGFYYNPNIHPPTEYKKRRNAAREISKKLGFELIEPSYKMEEFFRGIVLNEGHPERCKACWELRLSKTADTAKENGFQAFTTTLLISPYQDHKLIKEIGQRLAREKGIEFCYEDFRKGFRESQEEAKKEELYRQKYCGCVFSELERADV
ncbi:epoxyqueuosine reductase QueH [Candidatus Omnitrophota bacterium]